MTSFEKTVAFVGFISLIAIPICAIWGIWREDIDVLVKIVLTSLVLVLFSGLLLKINKNTDADD